MRRYGVRPDSSRTGIPRKGPSGSRGKGRIQASTKRLLGRHVPGADGQFGRMSTPCDIRERTGHRIGAKRPISRPEGGIFGGETKPQSPAIGQGGHQSEGGDSHRFGIASPFHRDRFSSRHKHFANSVEQEDRPMGRRCFQGRPDLIPQSRRCADPEVVKRRLLVESHPRMISEARLSRNARFALRSRWNLSDEARNTSGVWT